MLSTVLLKSQCDWDHWVHIVQNLKLSFKSVSSPPRLRSHFNSTLESPLVWGFEFSTVCILFL